MKEYTVEVDGKGTKYWYLHGKLHREDGPAIEYANGTKFWYLNDEPHREDGPAIEYADGTKYWYLNGDRHRIDGPAVEWADGTKCWYFDGKLHREDGPAIEWGSKSWWLNGIQYSEKEYWNQLSPAKELTVNEIEKLLGYKIKVVGNT